MEVEEVVVDVQAAKQELKAELSRADMADGATVTLLDRFHQQLDEHGRFATQFLEIDVGAVGRQTTIRLRKKIRHLDRQLLGFVGILYEVI